MKKFIIILSSIVLILGASLFGAYLYITHPSEEHELKNFSFKLPDGLECIDYTVNYSGTYKFLGETIFIRDIDTNCDLETVKDYVYRISEDVKFEKLEGYPYDGYYCTAKPVFWDENDEKNLQIGYILGTDTNYFNIYCDCTPLKAKIIKPVLAKIAKTVKYTSDFRLADKPDVYDCEYLSVYTGSKYYCYEHETYSSAKSDYILYLDERYANTDDFHKINYPFLEIKVYDNGKSPVDLADDVYNGFLETEDSVKDIRPDGFYDEVTRDQLDMFGLKCELVHSVMDKYNCFDYYFFNNGKYTYRIEASYCKDIDEADVKEMLDGITIKETVQK